MKRQFILPLNAALNETRERYSKHVEAVRVSGPSTAGPFHFDAEFRMFNPVQTPVGHVRDILFTKIDSDNVMLALYQLFGQAIEDSRDMFARETPSWKNFGSLQPRSRSHASWVC
jgi:hypothetical protein